MGDKIVVTGATGFVGSRLRLPILLGRGYAVTCRRAGSGKGGGAGLGRA